MVLKSHEAFGRRLPGLLWALLLACVFICRQSLAVPPAGYYLVWNDEFNGTSLDTTKWDYWLLGNRRDAVNVTSVVAVGGGYLTITTYTSNGVHYTSMIATDGTFRSRYGYWESSILWGDTNGMWSAFWMQSPTMGTYLNDPFVSGSEIDIVEHRYVDGSTNNIANIVQNNIHWNGYGSAAKSAGSGNIGSGLGTGFHTYGFLWTPSVYTLYVDGSNLRAWNFSNNGVPVSQSTEWAILSSEVDDTSTTWAGYIPPAGYGSLATSTTKLTVDYVRYYAPTNMIFWTGAGSAYLTNAANYVSNMPPLSASDLQFSSLSGNNLSPAPGQDLAVDGLVFLNMNNGFVLGGSNTLTLGAGGIDMIAANHTVTLNCPINIGANQTWAIGPNNPGNTLNANSSISGSGTLTKATEGTLILNGTNSFSGTLNVDTSSTTSSDGIVRITRSENVANVAAISIRNNNSGSSTLQLDGSLGNVTVAPNITLNGRNTNVVAIENRSGSNSLGGGISINVGGGFYLLQSDAGSLNLGGIISSVATGARTFTFQGAGNFYVSGSIQNGSATVNLAKTNSGTLTLAGTNRYTGSTTLNGGALVVNGALAGGPVIVTAGTLGGSGSIGGAVSIQSGSTLAPGGSLTTLAISNTLSLAGAVFFELNTSNLTSDSVTALTQVTYGGTLRVTNLSGTFVAGQAFKLFSASVYGGTFAGISPSTPGPGLLWNTNTLTTDGMLRVAAIPPTSFYSPSFDGSNFNFSVSNGQPFDTWSLLSTTDLSLPLPQWPVVGSGSFDANGAFSFTGVVDTASSPQFFRVREP
jgi:autotransporter-associated beta strand protein